METLRRTKEEIDDVVNCLNHGGVVAFPTDTVYGVGVVMDNEDALQRLKKSKGRSDDKPIPMMISKLEQLEKVACLSDTARRLIRKFMPGALTIICNKRKEVPAFVTNGFQTIGIRMPQDDFILDMIDRIGKPLLVTSANLSDHPTGTTFSEVMDQLDGRIDMIVKGMCGLKQSSTIVDATQDEIKILRQGPISEAEIKASGRVKSL